MPPEGEQFDPTAPEQREIGREMIEESTGMGSVIAHLYRGEVSREITWRERLDSTTNWAVTIVAAILALSFSSEVVSHAIILVGMVIAVVFLVIEAGRFQRYDVWRSRVRSMQQNLFANALDPSRGVEQRDWRRQLSEDYRNPETKTPFRRAIVHRLRRVYLPLLTGLVLVWLVRLNGADGSLLQAATVSGVPGWVVACAVGGGYLALLALAAWPGASATSETGESGDVGDLDREE